MVFVLLYIIDPSVALSIPKKEVIPGRAKPDSQSVTEEQPLSNSHQDAVEKSIAFNPFDDDSSQTIDVDDDGVAGLFHSSHHPHIRGKYVCFHLLKSVFNTLLDVSISLYTPCGMPV